MENLALNLGWSPFTLIVEKRSLDIKWRWIENRAVQQKHKESNDFEDHRMKFNLAIFPFHCVKKSSLDILPNYLLLYSTEKSQSWVLKLRWCVNGFQFRWIIPLSLETMSDEDFYVVFVRHDFAWLPIHHLMTQEYRSPPLGITCYKC